MRFKFAFDEFEIFELEENFYPEIIEHMVESFFDGNNPVSICERKNTNMTRDDIRSYTT